MVGLFAQVVGSELLPSADKAARPVGRSSHKSCAGNLQEMSVGTAERTVRLGQSVRFRAAFIPCRLFARGFNNPQL